MSDKELEINEENLQKLVPARQPNDTMEQVTSMSFSNKGDSLILSAGDDSMYIYDMKTGQRSRSVNSRKYGCSHVRFASDSLCALHGSTKIDNTIRYLSLTDNKYIRYFQGHDGLVTGIGVSPLDDMFLSVAEDKTIRLWDLKTYNCVGLMNVEAPPIAAFDTDGLLFAAGLDNRTVKLYDLRSFDKGPFSSFNTVGTERLNWTSMRFSPCAKYIMICTNTNTILIIDAFSGVIKHALREHQNIGGASLNASFTPDSNFIMVGSSDGFIYFYKLDTGDVALKLQAPAGQTCHFTEFSPTHFAAVTADKVLTLWCASDDLKGVMA